MNIDIRHKLIDLRSEINKERDQKIIIAKQDYLDTVSNTQQIRKDDITSIKTAFRQAYADKKTAWVHTMIEDNIKQGIRRHKRQDNMMSCTIHIKKDGCLYIKIPESAFINAVESF